jgi:hypothetical protein
MTTATLPGVFNAQFFTSTGDLASGYRLYTYAPGTTTHQTIYTDAAAAVAHTYVSDGSGGQYIAINSRGEIAAPPFISASTDFCLKTAAGATVWTRRATTQDSAETIAGSTGAGLVGLSPTASYSASTVGAALHGMGRVLQGEDLDPTGLTDNTTIFKTLFDYCIPRGIPVIIPAGSYLVSGEISTTTLIAAGSLFIECQGPVTITVNSASTAFLTLLSCYTTASNSCRIRGPLTINGNNKVGNAIYVRHASTGGEVDMDGVTISNIKNVNVGASENQAILISGRYAKIDLSDISIDTVNRSGVGTATKGITCDLLEGVGTIRNSKIARVLSTGFTGDADGIYLGGYTAGAAYSQRSGRWEVHNLQIEDCQGRSFKAQHQNVDVRGLRIIRQYQATFDLADVDFQLGGGDVSGLEFVYLKDGVTNNLHANFYPIAVQQQCTDRANRCNLRNILFRAEMQVTRLCNIIVGASALDGVTNMDGVELQPLGSLTGSHFSRCVMEFDAGQVAASTGKTHIRVANVRGDVSSKPLLGHISYGSSVATKLSWELVDNNNTGTVGSASKVVGAVSGSAIPSVLQFMCRDNLGYIDMMAGLGGGAGTGWAFNYRTLPVGCRFHYDLGSGSTTNGPGSLGSSGLAFVEVLGHAYDTSAYKTVRVTKDDANAANTVFYTCTGAAWGAIK